MGGTISQVGCRTSVPCHRSPRKQQQQQQQQQQQPQWNSNVYHLIHKSPPLVPSERQINPVHNLLSYVFQPNLMHFPLLRSFKTISSRIRNTFRNMLSFYVEKLLATPPNVRCRTTPLRRSANYLFSTIAADLLSGCSLLLCNLRKRHVVVTRTHLSQNP
jgi:hypothetical protein